MITKDTKIIDILSINENAAAIFRSFGMGCLGCMMAHAETLEQAVAVHGIDLNELLEALNAQ